MANMEWQEQANCKGVGKQFFPNKDEYVTDNIRFLCGTCPVYYDCRDWSIPANEKGIWAAMTHDDREAIRKAELRGESVERPERPQLRVTVKEDDSPDPRKGNP